MNASAGDCSSAISEVLQHIEAGALLPPLVVLQTLAKNKQLKVPRDEHKTTTALHIEQMLLLVHTRNVTGCALRTYASAATMHTNACTALGRQAP